MWVSASTVGVYDGNGTFYGENDESGYWLPIWVPSSSLTALSSANSVSTSGGSAGSSPQPAQPRPCKDSYLSLVGGFAMGPAYWVNLTFASDGALYLGLNHGSGAGLGMLSASYGVIPNGSAEKVFTGPGGSSGVSYFGAGVNGQGNTGGYAVDAGISTPGIYAGMGYGFKIWDPNWGDQVSTSFHDKQGNLLPRCTQ